MAKSSIEVEYRYFALALAKIMWQKFILWKLQVSMSHTPLLFCDNVNNIQLASNPIMHAWMKHVEIDWYFVRDQVINGILDVQKVNSK